MLMNQVFRREVKFLLSITQGYQLEARLSSLLSKDPHCGPWGYQVRSLYFDTVNDKDFKEKEDGLNLRRKLRLRIYDPRADFAMLELKQKQGAYQKKRSLRLSRKDAEMLISGNYGVLMKDSLKEEDLAAECYAIMQGQCYRPKVIVEYNRMAYIAKEGQTRITLDRSIRANEGNMNLFDEALSLYPVFDLSAVILEVKYSGFLLDYIRQILCTADQPEISLSKYYMARQCAAKPIL